MTLRQAIIAVGRAKDSDIGDKAFITQMEWGWLIATSIFVHVDELNMYLKSISYEPYHIAH